MCACYVDLAVSYVLNIHSWLIHDLITVIDINEKSDYVCRYGDLKLGASWAPFVIT